MEFIRPGNCSPNIFRASRTIPTSCPMILRTIERRRFHAGRLSALLLGLAAGVEAAYADGPSAGGVASPSMLAPGQSTLVTVTVTNGLNATITNVVLDASQLGVASPVALNSAGNNVFTNTVTVGPGTVYGNQVLTATVTDGAGLQGQTSIPVFLPTPLPYKSSPTSLDTWRSNRFGMFIHWGPVTLTGLEISWSRANTNPQCPNNGPTPAAVYDALYTRFNPTNFNAVNWVATAQDRKSVV